MGNSSSSGRGQHDETVDFGFLTPQGVYTGPRDWNHTVVTQFIVERKLAPFYRPLEDYEESWDDDQILAARKEPPEQDTSQGDTSITRAESHASSLSSRTHHKRPSAAGKEPARNPEAAIYRGAVDCPICFLYYPPNINYSRCCNQAICTECFVQIKRADPTTTHLVSEPACCPYCVQPDFGVVYTPPPWRAGINSEGASPPSWPTTPTGQSSDTQPSAAMKRRRKSFGADSPDVVTTDQIRPDWEAKLAAVRAAVTRRANRRIIMRQVGDRLIPVGVTSGRVHALPTGEEGAGENGEGSGGAERGGSRRSRRRQQNQDLNQLLGSMGMAGQDLEELMVMEAMRLSLLEHEEQQRKEREAEAKRQAEQRANIPSRAEDRSARVSTSTSDTTPPATASTAVSATSLTESSSTISPTSSQAPSVPLTPDAPSEGSQGSTGSSSAGGRPSTEQSLSPSPPGKKGKHKRGDGSIIGVALRAATNAASSVISSPDGEGSRSPAGAGPSSSSLNSATPQISEPSGSSVDPTTVPLPQSTTRSSPTPADPQPSASASAPASTAPSAPDLPSPSSSSTPPSLSPNPDYMQSMVSSDGETAYDVLLSRTGSTLSNKPLLETPASDSPASGIVTTTTNGSGT